MTTIVGRQRGWWSSAVQVYVGLGRPAVVSRAIDEKGRDDASCNPKTTATPTESTNAVPRMCGRIMKSSKEASEGGQTLAYAS